MKLSLNLPDEDVAFLDAYARWQEMPSRSAVVQRAVRLLRAYELGVAYAEAWAEWADGPDADLYDVAGAQGLPQDG
jgi:Arc/MetJ-type ribon-helix-helix transcriptional regulator